MIDKQVIIHLQQNQYSLALKGLYHILPEVKKFMNANSGNNDDAEDIFQDALVILYKNVQRDGFVLNGTLKNYLMAIVRNCWMQELRRRKKLKETELNIDVPVDEYDDDHSFAFAKTAFGLLGEKCRQILIMFYFKKNSYTEIAIAMAFSDDKVAKNQKYRCLQKAKENYLQLSQKN